MAIPLANPLDNNENINVEEGNPVQYNILSTMSVFTFGLIIIVNILSINQKKVSENEPIWLRIKKKSVQGGTLPSAPSLS